MISTLFDQIVEPEPGIQYGVLKGYAYPNRAVLIKIPCGESFGGYWDPYFQLAKRLNLRLGVQVICAENHTDGISEKYDLPVLKKCVSKDRNSPPEYSFIGIGESATFGLSYLCHKIDFKKMLLINMPISHRLGETIDLLNQVDRKKIKFVYGSEDSSYRYTPLLKRLYVDVITVKGADHHFTGMKGTFSDLQKLL